MLLLACPAAGNAGRQPAGRNHRTRAARTGDAEGDKDAAGGGEGRGAGEERLNRLLFQVHQQAWRRTERRRNAAEGSQAGVRRASGGRSNKQHTDARISQRAPSAAACSAPFDSPSATHTVGREGSKPAASRASAQEGSERSAATAAQWPQRSGWSTLSMLLKGGKAIERGRDEGGRRLAGGGGSMRGVQRGSMPQPCCPLSSSPEVARQAAGRRAGRLLLLGRHLRAHGSRGEERGAQRGLVNGWAQGLTGAPVGLQTIAAIGASNSPAHLGGQLLENGLLGGHHVGTVHLKPAQVCNIGCAWMKGQRIVQVAGVFGEGPSSGSERARC